MSPSSQAGPKHHSARSQILLGAPTPAKPQISVSSPAQPNMSFGPMAESHTSPTPNASGPSDVTAFHLNLEIIQPQRTSSVTVSPAPLPKPYYHHSSTQPRPRIGTKLSTEASEITQTHSWIPKVTQNPIQVGFALSPRPRPHHT